jgi:hypothetical protein
MDFIVLYYELAAEKLTYSWKPREAKEEKKMVKEQYSGMTRTMD